MNAKSKVAAAPVAPGPTFSKAEPQLAGDGLDEAEAMLRVEPKVNAANALAAAKKAEHFFSTGFARP